MKRYDLSRNFSRRLSATSSMAAACTLMYLYLRPRRGSETGDRPEISYRLFGLPRHGMPGQRWHHDLAVWSAVQPRGCGELAVSGSPGDWRIGSAPRVRGTHRLVRVETGAGRFSPAGAGNSRQPARVLQGQPVQPRGCGELGGRGVLGSPRIGSAPRVRGTLARGRAVIVGDRFSPAGAGNSGAARPRARPRAVQPRGCGELSPGSAPEPPVVGSAPRVRGTLVVELSREELGRFSPAGAGNSQPVATRTCSAAVQPRGCGELVAISVCTYNAHGSAPRVRGTRTAAPGDGPRPRFSPAGAGNSNPAQRVSNPPPVQPRGCGEL